MKHDYSRQKTRRRTRYRVRCSCCEARRTLRRHPDHYQHPPRCRCGSRRWRVDWFRTAGIEKRRYTCRCIGYPFPHRRGSNCVDLPFFCMGKAA